MKKYLIYLMLAVLGFTTLLFSAPSDAFAAEMKPLGSTGWKYRVDKPHVDGINNDWHVHVEKGKIKGAETVKGGKSHNKTLTSAGVPKSIQKKVKETSDFKKGKEKQAKLDKERKEASKFSWSDLILKPFELLVGVAVAAGLTVWQVIKAGPNFIFG
ncbi:hypothetical protein CW357_17725 [Rummeliibacillus sp. TYF005]|uniref:hypothetical protein n=1 Tax=Rummeliibacillus sp. TYF005 TaxID=2058214 RepID=UPI000F54686C|nr:hypothetical protein [Rummeliibacillus sp. TYF005]RPJ93991.1 hypothetical protein CW357_17725 [Rummeliibacillus sp. TYF005]